MSDQILPPSNNASLAEWVSWLEALDPSKIEMGLDRTAQVLSQMGLSKPIVPVITVAGTNGKGSTVAYLQSVFHSAGLRCGSTTSPHLFALNERISIGGNPISDNDLVTCLSAVEIGRGDVALTYFEFLIVAALYWFDAQKVDVIVLEVGLGGRLDATNCIDADIAVVTAIGLDHKAWLGTDLERIAEEKVAICREGRPVVIADSRIPHSADALAQSRGAEIVREGLDYQVQRQGDGLQVAIDNVKIDIPYVGIPSVPLTNAGAAVVAVSLLQPRMRISHSVIGRGIANATLAGRGQQLEIGWLGRRVHITFDVAHNADSAAVLSKNLFGSYSILNRDRVALCAMLADKECAAVYTRMEGAITTWHLAGIDGPRGQSAQSLADSMGNNVAWLHQDVETALPVVLNQMVVDNQLSLVVFGSFETVAVALTWCREHEI